MAVEDQAHGGRGPGVHRGRGGRDARLQRPRGGVTRRSIYDKVSVMYFSPKSQSEFRTSASRETRLPPRRSSGRAHLDADECMYDQSVSQRADTACFAFASLASIIDRTSSSTFLFSGHGRPCDSASLTTYPFSDSISSLAPASKSCLLDG